MRYLLAALLVAFAAPAIAAPPPPAGYKIVVEACEKADVVMKVNGETIKCGQLYVVRGYREDHVTLTVTYNCNGKRVTRECVIELHAGYIVEYTLYLREPMDPSKWC